LEGNIAERLASVRVVELFERSLVQAAMASLGTCGFLFLPPFLLRVRFLGLTLLHRARVIL
jgi:hypothetical protein